MSRDQGLGGTRGALRGKGRGFKNGPLLVAGVANTVASTDFSVAAGLLLRRYGVGG